MIDIPESVIATIRLRARSGICEGRDRLPIERAYYRRCTLLHYQTGTVVMFTRDRGHHKSGWFKNPDFERCTHLSLSFRQPLPTQPPEACGSPHRLVAMGAILELAPFDNKVADVWVSAILGETRKLAWIESAKTPGGIQLGVKHWRVFCDQNWEPIKPRGEVYSRELTEAGWQSWSDQHSEPNWLSAE